ncbi:Lon protease family protein [Vibrio sp. SM6]|uniref:endopeptidase La n=1 Tax=Vibrio agarilyticus TaxID=2726741 RepID=A0A7X8YGN6_9VIBR|nr:Lon protease family protein [Vibrio agarilyticus]NLS12562.1 Lon protease family protein [Vibrio agarilyticus]
MNNIDWQLVTPQFTRVMPLLEHLESIPYQPYTALQPRLVSALKHFATLQSHTRFLAITGCDNPIYRTLVAEAFETVAQERPIITCEKINGLALFDHYYLDSQEQIVIEPGLFDAANHGFLVISANMLIANPLLWPQIKAAVLGEPIEPITFNKHQVRRNIQPREFDIKLVVIGDREQMAEVEYLDEDCFRNMMMFTELEEDFHLTDTNIEHYTGYVKWITQRYQLPEFDCEALLRLLTAGTRETEDQHYLPLSPIWLQNYLALAAQESQGNMIRDAHMLRVFEQKYYREAYLPQRALEDILGGQVIIETTGEQIGQVNGLTVIDVAGHPVSYGEPARISCVIHFGDGDISDVERKAELGGNLHAKGMMIMQAFVSSELNLDAPLPYSASIVFEQSYSEVDGDSASLAELCSFVSALSEIPVNQQIAVTGAVDQFGRVQAVGGLNEKIEGFYQVCRHQGFTGHQGVILPTTNLKHLTLHPEVVESIRLGEFHIWPVSTVDDAIPLIMGKPFRDEEEESVIGAIAERIENFERHEHPISLFERVKNWFV